MEMIELASLLLRIVIAVNIYYIAVRLKDIAYQLERIARVEEME